MEALVKMISWIMKKLRKAHRKTNMNRVREAQPEFFRMTVRIQKKWIRMLQYLILARNSKEMKTMSYK
jgi:hypothetical protein